MENKCDWCQERISDWQMTSGKATVIGPYIVHNDCLTHLRSSEMTIEQIIEKLKGEKNEKRM